MCLRTTCAIATGWSAIAPRSRTLLLPYIALAADGKIALDAYPVVAWIERIKEHPGYVGMPGLS